jgi:hypothetical protein
VAVVPADELVQGRGREVAEDRVRAAGLHGGEEAAVERWVGVSDRVNPAVKGVEPSPAHPHFDRIAAQAASPQVIEGDDSVLLRGERRHPLIWPSGEFVGLGPTK